MTVTTADADGVLKKYGRLYKTPGGEKIRIMKAAPGQQINVNITYRKDSAGMILGLREVYGNPFYNYIGYVIKEYWN